MFNSLIKKSRAYRELAERAARAGRDSAFYREQLTISDRFRETWHESRDHWFELCNVWQGRAERTMARLVEAEADAADFRLGLELAEAENDALIEKVKELMDEKNTKKQGKKRAKAGVAKEQGKGRVPKAGGASVPKVRG